MKNFTYYVPTKIHFGKGMISHLSELAESGSRVLLVYGGGSGDNACVDALEAVLVRAFHNVSFYGDHVREQFFGLAETVAFRSLTRMRPAPKSLATIMCMMPMGPIPMIRVSAPTGAPRFR